MSRKKQTTAPVLPWTTSKDDMRQVGSWTAFDSDLLSHPAFVALNRTAALTYIMLAMAARGKREFTCPYTTARKCGITAASYRLALQELQDAGFVRVSSGAATRQENQIQFINDWKGRSPMRKKQRRTPPEHKAASNG